MFLSYNLADMDKKYLSYVVLALAGILVLSSLPLGGGTFFSVTQTMFYPTGDPNIGGKAWSIQAVGNEGSESLAGSINVGANSLYSNEGGNSKPFTLDLKTTASCDYLLSKGVDIVDYVKTPNYACCFTPSCLDDALISCHNKSGYLVRTGDTCQGAGTDYECWSERVVGKEGVFGNAISAFKTLITLNVNGQYYNPIIITNKKSYDSIPNLLYVGYVGQLMSDSDCPTNGNLLQTVKPFYTTSGSFALRSSANYNRYVSELSIFRNHLQECQDVSDYFWDVGFPCSYSSKTGWYSNFNSIMTAFTNNPSSYQTPKGEVLKLNNNNASIALIEQLRYPVFNIHINANTVGIVLGNTIPVIDGVSCPSFREDGVGTIKVNVSNDGQGGQIEVSATCTKENVVQSSKLYVAGDSMGSFTLPSQSFDITADSTSTCTIKAVAQYGGASDTATCSRKITAVSFPTTTLIPSTTTTTIPPSNENCVDSCVRTWSIGDYTISEFTDYLCLFNCKLNEFIVWLGRTVASVVIGILGVVLSYLLLTQKKRGRKSIQDAQLLSLVVGIVVAVVVYLSI